MPFWKSRWLEEETRKSAAGTLWLRPGQIGREPDGDPPEYKGPKEISKDGEPAAAIEIHLATTATGSFPKKLSQIKAQKGDKTGHKNQKNVKEEDAEIEYCGGDILNQTDQWQSEPWHIGYTETALVARRRNGHNSFPVFAVPFRVIFMPSSSLLRDAFSSRY